MNGWEEKKLEELAVLQRGFDLPVKKRIPGEYPLITASGQDGTHNESKVQGPGVVTGRSGTLGQVFYVEKDFWPLNTTLWVKDFKGSDRKFTYYFLKTLQLENYNDGSGVPTLNRNHVHPLLVKIPSLNEQSIIADVLSSFDDKIELNRKMNEVLEEMGQTLFRHWFVDFEFPWDFEKGEFSWDGKPYKSSGGEMIESELGQIPKGWTVKSISDPKNSEIISSGIDTFNGEKIYLATADVKGASIVSKETKISFEKRPSRANMQPIEHSIWFAKMSGSRKLLMFGSDDSQIEEYILSTGFAGLKAEPRSFYFLWALIQSDHFEKQKERYVGGGVQVGLNSGTIGEIKIVTPPSQIKEEFGDVVGDWYLAIKANQEMNEHLSQTRDLLLPRLMSGKLRVPVK